MTKLSICIPTYNRGKFLRSNLLSIYNQIDENDDVEIIVSNNCSNDDTSEIVKPYLVKPNFKYYEQIENIGFAKNLIKSVNDYAIGEFCWVIGDDDFILPRAINNILKILNDNIEIDFIYAKVNEIHIDEYYKYMQPFHAGMVSQTNNELVYQFIDEWEKLLTPQYSIIFMGEIMASVFRRNIWLTYNLIDIHKQNLEVLDTTYPHAVIFANTFIGKKAIYLKTPSILALAGNREWWDNLGYIILVHIKDLLALYKSKGVSATIMKNCYDHFIQLSIPHAVSFFFHKKKHHREKIFLRQYFKEIIFINPKLTFNSVLLEMKQISEHKLYEFRYKLKNRIKSLVKKKQKSDYELNIENFKNNYIDIPINFKINGVIKILNEGKITIGENFKANSGENNNMIGGDVVLRLIAEKKNADISIGNNVGMSNCTLVCWNKITIEDNVLIGGGVKIWDTNFHSLNPEIRIKEYDYDIKTAPILIKEFAFIGAGSTILKGVTIGKNTIIAAGSVVVNNIPNDVIAGGNPCRVIKNLELSSKN